MDGFCSFTVRVEDEFPVLVVFVVSRTQCLVGVGEGGVYKDILEIFVFSVGRDNPVVVKRGMEWLDPVEVLFDAM